MKRLALAAIPTLLLAIGLIELSARVEQDGATRVLGIQVTPAPTPEAGATAVPGFFSPGAPRAPLPQATPRIVLGTPRPVTAATPTPRTTTAATPAPAPVRSTPKRPATINCADPAQQQYCSNGVDVDVKDGKLAGMASGTRSVSGVPTYSAEVTPLKGDAATPAKHGEEVGFVKVRLRVANDTSKTFVFTDGDLTLVVKHQAAEKARYTQNPAKPGFEMTPGGFMEATFVIPLDADGKWGLQGQTFFYEK